MYREKKTDRGLRLDYGYFFVWGLGSFIENMTPETQLKVVDTYKGFYKLYPSPWYTIPFFLFLLVSMLLYTLNFFLMKELKKLDYEFQCSLWDQSPFIGVRSVFTAGERASHQRMCLLCLP